MDDSSREDLTPQRKISTMFGDAALASLLFMLPRCKILLWFYFKIL